MNRPMRAISRIPPKKESKKAAHPPRAPKAEARASVAFEAISVRETYIMTPAEKPRVRDINFGFVFFERTAIILPIPVLSPAKSAIRKAGKISFMKNLSLGRCPNFNI